MSDLKTKTHAQGFTLVEIMIVVVIIGLLAAMAVPGFMKVRVSTVRTTMDNDARLLASAAHQYFMERGVTSATIGYSQASGYVTGEVQAYISKIGRGYTTVPDPMTVDTDFNIEHPVGGTRTYNPQGKLITATP